MQSTQGFYERLVFPWLNDKLNADPSLERLRGEALAPARGRVIEIGFGTGLNLQHYPPAVESIVAVEPSGGMHERALPRIAASSIPVEFIEGIGENIPMPDGGFDTAVSVLTLCTVSDPARVISEMSRVLRDDGRLLVMEHGLCSDPAVARWQRRLNPIQKVVACGCRLDRPIAKLVEHHGFRFESMRELQVPKMPRTHGWVTIGTAIKMA